MYVSLVSKFAHFNEISRLPRIASSFLASQVEHFWRLSVIHCLQYSKQYLFFNKGYFLDISPFPA